MQKPASDLMSKVDKLANLPNTANDTSYDNNALKDATEGVVQAASAMKISALDPGQWLEDFRLAMFRTNFEGLGAMEIVDFTEVLDQDLMGMAMPLLQFRRFRKYAADIPPAGGHSYRLDLYAADIAGKAAPGAQCHAWLGCLRLSHFEQKFTSIGVRDLRDFREVREDDLVAMGMPMLQRRRFLMSAAVALPNLPDSAESALATVQSNSAICSTPPQWLETLHLTNWIPAFDALGCLDVVDMREVLRADLEEMELPLLQTRRFLAAVAIIPDPPELPGRRWETPSKWLDSLRLKRYDVYLTKLGVDRVVDFAEVLDLDLMEMGMSPLQRRRFRAAVAVDAQPTLESDAVTGAMKQGAAEEEFAKTAVAALRGEDVLNLTPARWLALIRCENFVLEFEELGVEAVLDFPEVTEDDLNAMGLPTLHKRRFTVAAVQVEELHLFHKEREVANSGEPESTFEWLKVLRLGFFIDAFQRLGVEEIDDFAEVLMDDIVDMGMKPLHRRRFQMAVAELLQ